MKHKVFMSAMVEAQTKKKGLTTSSSLGNTLLQRKNQYWMLEAIRPGSFSGKHERMLPQICGEMDVLLNSPHCRSWPLEGDSEKTPQKTPKSAKSQVSRTWLWSLFQSGGMMQRSQVVCTTPQTITGCRTGLEVHMFYSLPSPLTPLPSTISL